MNGPGAALNRFPLRAGRPPKSGPRFAAGTCPWTGVVRPVHEPPVGRERATKCELCRVSPN